MVDVETPWHAKGPEIEHLLATRHPVMVVFERAGDETCRALVPVVADLAAEFIERVRVVRVDDTDAEAAARFGLRRVPTLLFRRPGREVGRVEGGLAREDLAAWVRFLVGVGPRPQETSPKREG